MSKKRKSHFHWSWILLVALFALSAVDIRFALAGILCMIMPLYLALRGKGKVHCSHYCPRGSFLQKMLGKISFNNKIPSLFRSNIFKSVLFVFMMGMFALSFYLGKGDMSRTGAGVFRLLALSSAAALVMGIIYKPRTWCTVCPMGHATSLISKRK